LLFPTIEFGIFFIFVFFISWATINTPNFRKYFLIAVSYFFYGYWDWRFAFLLFAVSVNSYFFGYLIVKNKSQQKKKSLMIFSVSISLIVLSIFKYYGFFVLSFINLMSSLNLTTKLPLLEIILPVGISFFTFQAISYVIDVYREKIPACENISDVLLYVSFFPQLVAGPIVRAEDFIPQLQSKPNINNIDAVKAFFLILSGLIKKILIANYLSTLIVDKVFENPSAHTAIDNLFAVYGYAIQIYCDFSAYSDIAIGVALLLGYNFKKNFNQPYRAFSIQDFWHRWHISLSTWLRDYLYIPLGGSKNGTLKTYRNLFLTMLLGGLWHGAAWQFVFWGALHGVGLMIERYIYQKFNITIAKKITKIILGIFVFHFVSLGWIFFRASSFETALTLIQSIFSWEFSSQLLTPFILGLIVIGLLINIIPIGIFDGIGERFAKLHPALQGFLLGMILIIVGILSPDGISPFIYFQF
jgi:D-alanyl-lipoteichoic acid acyltransferase DltB (MBOAT superfamily)